MPKRARSDGEIRRDVNAGLCAVLCVLEKLPAVSVENGVVILRGTVRWNFQRVSAERAADAVIGVRGVLNRISVGQSVRVFPLTGRVNPDRIATPMPLLDHGDGHSLHADRPVLATAS